MKLADVHAGLGAGGEESPYLVNAANAVTFGYAMRYRLIILIMLADFM